MRTHPGVGTVVGALALVLPTLSFVASGRAQLTESLAEPAPAYVLRATSRWASVINEVLSRVAEPLEIAVPLDRTPAEHLSTVCAGKPPKYQDAGVSGRGQQRVRISPCIRVRRDVEVTVTEGDTLEGLAIRHGLPVTAADRLKVKSTDDSSPIHLTDPQNLKVGDKVVVPEVPIWTNVVAKRDVAADRAAIVALLAAALDCGTQEPEECLVRREVTLLDRASVRKRELAPDTLARFSRLTIGRGGRSSSHGSLMSTAGAASEQPAAASVVTDLPAEPASTTPVAAEQWPYDVTLLAKILTDVADKMDRKATIGIADGGLADAGGGPLPAGVFAPSDEEIIRRTKNLQEPDRDDNDGNSYVDDLFGAGLKRLNEDLGDLLGSGDMGLCRSTIPDLGNWPADVLTQASHGAVVTSIAAALGVRRAEPAAAAALPKLVFYRMLGDACHPAADLNVNVAELFTAFEYLEKRSPIINISYKVDNATGRQLRDMLRPLVPNLNGLLILAAGNQNVKLDDNGGVCPACLGHDADNRGGSAAKRTIVVGAATRDLRREALSNYGRDTVKLFAPGDPTTGIDLMQNAVPAHQASTSFAAPYVALAAAIISSFRELNSWSDIRDRLEATVWPLHDLDSGAAATGLGVVDLVKAAAVRHDAIEVKEHDTNGHFVRRTYVGTLLTSLDGQVCPGYQLNEVKVHALRLSGPSTNGARTVRVHHRRKWDPAAPWKRKVDVLPACKPHGDLRLRTVFGESKTFSLSDVTHIQLRWIIDP